jgi:hypothetical protein
MPTYQGVFERIPCGSAVCLEISNISKGRAEFKTIININKKKRM